MLSWARTSHAARAAGVATGAMEHAAAYARDRVRFGQSIGSFEALIRLRDDALTGGAAARLMALYAAWAIDTARLTPPTLPAARASMPGMSSPARSARR